MSKCHKYIDVYLSSHMFTVSNEDIMQEGLNNENGLPIPLQGIEHGLLFHVRVHYTPSTSNFSVE